jgi:hypothetical protein
MRVKTWVELSDEVEVDLSGDQIAAAMLENDGDIPVRIRIKRSFNNFAGFLNGLTAEQVEALEPKVRELIHNFCVQQAARFANSAQGCTSDVPAREIRIKV